MDFTPKLSSTFSIKYHNKGALLDTEDALDLLLTDLGYRGLLLLLLPCLLLFGNSDLEVGVFVLHLLMVEP